MMFRDFRCVAVFDWDMVSLAGPESDLAWWIVMEHGGGRVMLPGLGTYDDLVDLWEDLTGNRARHRRYHVAYALFRLGGVLVRLNEQMLASGFLPPGTDIATNSPVVQQLALLLDLPAPGPVTATLPPLRRL